MTWEGLSLPCPQRRMDHASSNLSSGNLESPPPIKSTTDRTFSRALPLRKPTSTGIDQSLTGARENGSHTAFEPIEGFAIEPAAAP
jgi:hypothetical protein